MMVKTNPNVLWSECLALIRENVSESKFNACFKKIAFKSFSTDTKIILVEVDRFVYELLEENYVDLLTKVLTSTFGSDVKLNYRILDNGKKGPVIPSDPDEARATMAVNTPRRVYDTTQATAMEQLDPQLDPRQTFKNYIEGDSNKLPRSVGLAIAEHPNNSNFNPFFIFGPSGSGKTHLINAIGMRTKKLYPQKRVLYVSARLFEVQYTNAVSQNKVNDFIHFYQTIDMLIVDDVQEWEGKEKTQTTFFHIFNHLFRNGRRIILACDRPPADMKGMNERLVTRFVCGLTAELERPNVQLCIDILHYKIRRDGLSIPEDVVEYVANTANGSIRDLHGVINSLMAYSVVYNCPINMKLAERIKRAVKTDNEPLTTDDIVDAVCKHYNVTPAAINSKSRKHDCVTARQVAMYLAQKYTKMPASRIGRLIGGRDHSTVIYSCSQIEKRIKTEQGFKENVESIEMSFKLKS